MLQKLAGEGFDVVEFKEESKAPAGATYMGIAVTHYEVTGWIGYDFDIRLESAIDALKQVHLNEETDMGRKAIELLKEDMSDVGELVGRLFKHHILYLDIKPRNLAKNKDERIVLFDIDPGYFKSSRTKEEHGQRACEYLEFVKHKVIVHKINYLWGFLLQYFYAGMERVDGTRKLKKWVMEKNPLPKGYTELKA